MDRIWDRLWISAAPSIGAPLHTLGFVALLDLRDQDDLRGGSPKEGSVEVFRLGNRDGDPWTPQKIDEAYQFIRKSVRRGRVLVACGAGMSRSASIVIGYLVSCGIDPPTAHAIVRHARPKVAPLPNMLAAALRVAYEDVGIPAVSFPKEKSPVVNNGHGKEFG